MTSTLSFSLQSVRLVPSKNLTFDLPRDPTSFPHSTILSFTYLCFLILSLVFAFEDE
jgi:hypothetical protein